MFDPFSPYTGGDGFLDNVQFSAELPRLSYSWSAGQLILYWPSSFTNVLLQSRESVAPGAPWEFVPENLLRFYFTTADTYVVIPKPETNATFFRLLLGTGN